jgi:hypothetical protein
MQKWTNLKTLDLRQIEAFPQLSFLMELLRHDIGMGKPTIMCHGYAWVWVWV